MEWPLPCIPDGGILQEYHAGMCTELGCRGYAPSRGAFRAVITSCGARLTVILEPACPYHKGSHTAVETSLLLRNGRPGIPASTMRAQYSEVWQRTYCYC